MDLKIIDSFKISLGNPGVEWTDEDVEATRMRILQVKDIIFKTLR